jgi:hypothetical protein
MKNTKQTMTTHARVKGLPRTVEGVGHTLHMDNFYYSPDLFDDLDTRDINCRKLSDSILKEHLGTLRVRH